jgi:hypothetical protein
MNKTSKERARISTKEDAVRSKDSVPPRSMPPRRRSLDIAVAVRQQTPEEQRQYIEALDVFLTELTRQYLGSQGK